MAGLLHAPIKGSDRAEGIDLLRALLALWVLFAHLIPWTKFATHEPILGLNALADWGVRLFQNGGETHPAVLAFIVLSGYCIHRRGLRADRTDIYQYSVRRTFRIYPIYLMASLGAIAAYWAARGFDPKITLALSSTPEIYPSCVAAKLAAIPTIVPWLSDPPCQYQANGPLGTVMVEMALYAAYPFLLFGVGRRWSENTLWKAVILTWGFGTLSITAFPSLRWWWHNTSLFGFLPYWWIGVALFDDRFASFIRHRAPWIIGAWVGMVVALQFIAPHPPLVEVRKVLFALVVCFAILKLDRGDLRFPVLSEIGKSGYSLYAFHAPVCYTSLAFGLPWWWAVLSSIGIGYLSYLVIEAPSQAAGRWLAERRGVDVIRDPSSG